MSKLGIMNIALQACGSIALSSPDEDSANGRRIRAVYDDCLKTVLGMANWKCATKRAELAKSNTSPVFGFSSQFALPIDFVRIINVIPPDCHYTIENDFILLNSSTCFLNYVFLQTDANRYSSGFQNCLGLYIAWQICWAITQNSSLKQLLEGDFKQALQNSKSVDNTLKTPEIYANDTWMAARGYSGREMPWVVTDPNVDYGGFGYGQA